MSKFYGGALIVWAAVLFCSILLLSTTKTTPFDPDDKLYQQSISPDFDKWFSELIAAYIPATRSSVVLFTSGSCFCEILSQPHISSIEQTAKEELYTLHRLSIQDSPLGSIIPSTPAAAIFNRDGKLSYLGPLSSGAFCRSSAGLVDAFIKQPEHSILPGASLLLDARGCYCHNTEA